MTTDPPQLPPSATEQAIRQLAKWIAEHKVLMLTDVEPHLVSMVFLPVGLGALAHYPAELRSQLVVFAVHGVDHATGYAINGYPMFTECRLWRLEDFTAAVQLAVRALAALKTILGDVVAEDVAVCDARLVVTEQDLIPVVAGLNPR